MIFKKLEKVYKLNKRRYFDVTISHLISYENVIKQKITEFIVLKDCTSIKSADDEI